MEEKTYSENIFNEIQTLEQQIKNIKIENIDEKLLNDIKKIKTSTTIQELEQIENNELTEQIKIKKIAIKLNNFNFEQYIELERTLDEIELEITKKIEENNKKQKEIEKLQTKQKLLEFVYDLKTPIEEENKIEEIIKMYKENNEDPKEILKTIITDNLNYYTNKHKKEKKLTEEKMNELKIDKNDKQMIQEIKELISNTSNVQGNIEMTNYLLNLTDELFLEILEKDLSYNEQLIINIMYSLLEKINNNETIEQSLELLNILYETYIEKKSNSTEQKKEEQKLIFLRKPTTEDSYIYDDLEKIESKEQLKILEKEFNKLIKGQTRGKSLTGLSENLFEKKTLKTRITFKKLPNNYILIINCYIKGNKFTQNIREFIEKTNIKYQIHLYEALATENPEIIEQTLQKEKTKQISKQEKENYINNFVESENINILNYFKEGEKNARKNK